MKQHDFVLVFKLRDKNQDPRVYAEALQAYPDARPSFGIRGYLAVEFLREGHNLKDVKRRAERDILHVVPDAQLDVFD